jgi:hypothetical protein
MRMRFFSIDTRGTVYEISDEQLDMTQFVVNAASLEEAEEKFKEIFETDNLDEYFLGGVFD